MTSQQQKRPPKAYSAPRLVVYGKIGEVTLGGHKIQMDGQGKSQTGS